MILFFNIFIKKHINFSSYETVHQQMNNSWHILEIYWGTFFWSLKTKTEKNHFLATVCYGFEKRPDHGFSFETFYITRLGYSFISSFKQHFQLFMWWQTLFETIINSTLFRRLELHHEMCSHMLRPECHHGASNSNLISKPNALSIYSERLQ